jgi:hypothetical protein
MRSQNVLLLLFSLPLTASAEVTMTPLTGFGGDGWVAPLERPWLSDTGATERSIAYSKATDHLYVASRNAGNHIRILNPDTGEEATGPGELNLTPDVVSGGTLPLSAVCVANDGPIYACNLVSPISGTVPFKIYRWADETSVPTVAFTSTTITGTRIGDTLDAFGGDTATLLVAGEGNVGTTGSRNGYAIFTTNDGINLTGSLVTFPVIVPANPLAGDFRTGITFTDADSVIGSQGTGGFKFSRYSGTTGTFEQAKILTNVMERPMDYIVLGGKPLLATLETNSNANPAPDSYSTVRVYDLTNPAAPVLAAFGRTATSFFVQTTAGAGTGSVTWGKVTGNSAKLYALSTNNGIQAFTVTVPDETPFVISSVNLNAAAGKLTISWASTPGRTYRVEYSGDLTTWANAAAGIPADASATNTYEWTIPAGVANRALVRVVRE